MLDCGVHMGFQDMRKYPDFKAIGENFDKEIDLLKLDYLLLNSYVLPLIQLGLYLKLKKQYLKAYVYLIFFIRN